MSLPPQLEILTHRRAAGILCYLGRCPRRLDAVLSGEYTNKAYRYHCTASTAFPSGQLAVVVFLSPKLSLLISFGSGTAPATHTEALGAHVKPVHGLSVPIYADDAFCCP